MRASSGKCDQCKAFEFGLPTPRRRARRVPTLRACTIANAFDRRAHRAKQQGWRNTVVQCHDLYVK
jgi:hypothetical protein